MSLSTFFKYYFLAFGFPLAGLKYLPTGSCLQQQSSIFQVTVQSRYWGQQSTTCEITTKSETPINKPSNFTRCSRYTLEPVHLPNVTNGYGISSSFNVLTYYYNSSHIHSTGLPYALQAKFSLAGQITGWEHHLSLKNLTFLSDKQVWKTCFFVQQSSGSLENTLPSPGYQCFINQTFT